MPEFDTIDRSETNAEKYVLREKLFGTNKLLPLWVADMDIATPQCVRDAVQERLSHPVLGYEIMAKRAYEAQCEWVKRHHGWEIQPEWLSYSPSVVASIGCAIRAFSDEGDEVIVQTPVYPPFFEMVRNNHRKVVLNPLRKDEEGIYRFDLEDLKKKISPKTKLLLLCSPHNPVGRVWKRDELLALGELCLERGIIIVSDEVHSDIVYSGNTHLSIASLSSLLQEKTVTLMGPGKTFNMAGFSISTVAIASETLRDQFMDERKRVHFGDGALLSHVAFEAAYRKGDGWHGRLMHHLETNRDIIEKWSRHYPMIRMNSVEGSYLAWLDCHSLGLGDRELRDFFVHEAHLGLSPGLSFGKEGAGYMRLNFGVSTSVLEQALENLSQALLRNKYV